MVRTGIPFKSKKRLPMDNMTLDGQHFCLLKLLTAFAFHLTIITHGMLLTATIQPTPVLVGTKTAGRKELYYSLGINHLLLLQTYY